MSTRTVFTVYVVEIVDFPNKEILLKSENFSHRLVSRSHIFKHEIDCVFHPFGFFLVVSRTITSAVMSFYNQ